MKGALEGWGRSKWGFSPEVGRYVKLPGCPIVRLNVCYLS